MRVSAIAIVAAALVASVAASPVQPRATPAPDALAKRLDLGGSRFSITCVGLCDDGMPPDDGCDCGSRGNSNGGIMGNGIGAQGGENGRTTAFTYIGPGTAVAAPSSTIEEVESSSTEALPVPTTESTSSASTSTSSSSSTRTASPSVTPTPNAAAINAPGFQAAAAGLALGAAVFLF